MNPDSIILKCNQCGTKNRIPRNRLHDRPICGKCRTPISVSKIYDRPIIITDQTFHNEIISFSGPVLVDCWAPWCSACSMISPVLAELAKKYAGRVKIAKLNVDQNPITASQYAIQSLPTILVFKNGQVINRLAGAYPREEIEKQVLAII